MTSRRLWLLVSLLAVPMLLEATTGCFSKPPRPEGAASNAYTCACTCNPGDRVRTVAVQARADDAEERTSDDGIVLGNDDLRLTPAFRVGIRFAALGIPQGAVIQDAYVQFTAGQTDTVATDVTIRIEATDDAQAFAATTGNIGTRTYESAPTIVTWTGVPSWTSGDAGDAQKAAGLGPLVQAVVSRAGWTDASALVLRFDATIGQRLATSFDGTPADAPVLHVSYFDPTADVVAALPVCLPAELNPNITANAGDPDFDGDDDGRVPDAMTSDCENRVENTYKGLIDACGYFPNPGTNCDCTVVATNFYDRDKDGAQDPGEEYYGFVRETCDHQPTVCEPDPVNLPTDPDDPERCNDFDPVGFAGCVADALTQCAAIGTPPHECATDDCLTFVAATNAPNGEPICVAHASEAPPAIAFQLFGRRSTCELSGTSEIKVGDDEREPKQDPFTRGTVEILGGPCAGQSCAVGISTQLAMNPITFDVKWASDPTFNDIIQAGNSVLTAGVVDALGAASLPENSTAGVGRGRRGSGDPQAFEGGNEQALGVTANWAEFACALNGNLSGTVDSEDPEGLCEDGTTICRADSPDCDGIGGGVCTFGAPGDPLVVDVTLAGTLVNQPPTADAGGDRTVECTSPDGASFVLDGTGSSDPDGAGDIRVVSWRQGHRVGPEVGFDRTLAVSVGVGDSEVYVMRVFDAFAQMDEDTATAGVVDTTAPAVFCNAPATIPPPNRPLSFAATATDVCTTSVVPEIVSYECFKLSSTGAKLDKTKTCKVALDGDTITISPPQGVGQHIAWTVQATDGSGNVGEAHCEIEVVRR
jgi:hypothetical protein